MSYLGQFEVGNPPRRLRRHPSEEGNFRKEFWIELVEVFFRVRGKFKVPSSCGEGFRVRGEG
jgi:hypothetical protein